MIHAFLWCVAAIFFLVLGGYALGIAGAMLGSGVGSFFLAALAGIGAATLADSAPPLAIGLAVAAAVGCLGVLYHGGNASAKYLRERKLLTPREVQLQRRLAQIDAKLLDSGVKDLHFERAALSSELALLKEQREAESVKIAKSA